YNKGSLVFDMLSREVGRATFQRALHQITGGHRFQTITWSAFVRTVNTAAGRNLDWFFDQWLRRAGAPQFALSWTQQGRSVRVTITKPEPSYRAHLKIEVRGDGDEHVVRLVDVRDGRTVVDVDTGFAARAVVLDPGDEILKRPAER